MVNPVTGPYGSALALTTSSTSSYRLKRWYRQRKPYNLPLNWASAEASSKRTAAGNYVPGTYFGGLWQGCFTSTLPPGGGTYYTQPLVDTFARAYSVAFNRLRDKIRSGNSADLGTAAAESREALKMIISRLSSLLQAVRALRRGRIGDFHQALLLPDDQDIPLRAKKPLKRKQYASVFLEYQFGWKPMINDIGSAIDVLQGPIPQARFRGASRHNPGLVDTTYAGKPAFCNYDIGVALQCDVVVSNPNLWLANQLGFVNPAAIAWELIPFSFLVDWFVPVGSFLDAYSAFWGLSITNCHITRRLEIYLAQNDYSWPMTIKEKGWRLQRDVVTNFPIPSVVARLPDLKSLAGKAASLTALTIQAFSGLGR